MGDSRLRPFSDSAVSVVAVDVDLGVERWMETLEKFYQPAQPTVLQRHRPIFRFDSWGETGSLPNIM